MPTYSVVHDLLSGFPAAPSGVASFYQPGTLTPLVIYGDASGTAISNPVSLDSNGAAAVWLNQLARMIVQTSGGITVSDNVINQEGDTSVANTSTAFSAATLKGAMDTALQKFGGQDFQYVPSGSWVGMSPRSWLNSQNANVMAYGSVGATTVNDGVTPADSAIAAAIADVQAAGGGVVYLPPGTYLCNAGIAWTTTGITLRGSTQQSTTIKMNASNSNGITITSASGSTVENLALTSTVVSSGTGVTISGGVQVNLHNLTVGNFYVDVATSGSLDQFLVSGSTSLTVGVGAGAAGRCFSLTDTTRARMLGISTQSTQVSSFEYELLGATSMMAMGCSFSGNKNAVNFAASYTGAYARFIGNSMTNETTSFNFATAAMPRFFVNRDNGVDQSTTTSAVGATQTPVVAGFNEIVLTAASGGAGTVTVAAPTILPALSALDLYYDFVFVNASGGAVTWALNAIYHLAGAAAPASTDGHTVCIRFKWNGTVFREVSRADTVT